MNAERATKFIKGAAIILSAIGVNIEPDDLVTIGTAAGIIYGIITALEGIFFKKTEKKTI